MKFSFSHDFTGLARVGTVLSAASGARSSLRGTVTLSHDERHLRRKVLTLDSGERVMVDLPEPVRLAHGDRLVLEDGGEIVVVAADEDLFEIRPRDARHLAELAWHIGNRHLAAEIGTERILIGRDAVIGAMLTGLGADVRETRGPFEPISGAYSGHGPVGHEHG